MDGKAEEWLADGLAAALASVPGSAERDHVCLLLRSARRIRLGPDVARAAAETVRLACGSVERNIDRMNVLGCDPLWLEYPHAERVAAFGRDGAAVPGKIPETTGTLISVDPNAPEHAALFVAWRMPDGGIFHSYAVLHWDLYALRQCASSARAARADAAGADARLMAPASASVPPGLGVEMEIWQAGGADEEWRSSARKQTERDALGEHLFVLAALLMLCSTAVVLEPVQGAEDAEQWEARLLPPRRVLFRRGAGFRPAFFGGPVRWDRPR